VCHQTVGLIARQLEAAGIATVSLTSARDITASANPPRAVFVDFPLGHTAGGVGQRELNRAIVSAALNTLTQTEPGRITVGRDRRLEGRRHARPDHRGRSGS